jgi:DNA-binding XRE family transcriptional regulator
MVLSSEILNPLTIRQHLHLSQERMSHLLRVSCKTLWRWENNYVLPNSQAKVHLAKLKQVATLAQKVYTPEGVKEFIFTPLEEFGGHTAYDILSLGEYDRVIAALASDYEGLGY